MKKLLLALVILISASAIQAQEIPLPGGAVGDPWAVELKSLFGEESSITMTSGPAWATLDADGTIAGTPQSEGENRWGVDVTGGEFAGSHELIAEFWE